MSQGRCCLTHVWMSKYIGIGRIKYGQTSVLFCQTKRKARLGYQNQRSTWMVNLNIWETYFQRNVSTARGGGVKTFWIFLKMLCPNMGEGEGGGGANTLKFLSFTVFLSIIPNTMFLVLLVQEVTNSPHHFHIDTIKREDKMKKMLLSLDRKLS